MRPNKYNYNNQTGMYRHWILIRKRTLTTDELLQEIETFEDYGGYWTMVKTLKGSEIMGAGREQTKVEKRYVLKYAKSLDEFINSEHTSFEVVQNGVVYDVKSALNDDDMNNTVTIVVEGRS